MRAPFGGRAEARVRKKFVSRSLCIACVYLQVGSNANDGEAGSERNVDERALNPVIGAIQTVGQLAQLVVQIGQQVLPGLIANITLDNPMALNGGIGHTASRAFVQALIHGVDGQDKFSATNADATPAGNFGSDEH